MIQNIINTINIPLYFLFIFIKYKFGFISYNDSVKNMSNELSKINIVYAKILQWDILKNVSTSDDDLQSYFTFFNSNVPYTTNDIDYETLYKLNTYVKETKQDLIIENNYSPTNSGTVALVYKATLNGKPIIIKMLRKNIYKTIETGINNLITVISLLNFISSFFYDTNPALLTIIKRNSKMLLEQTDLQQEIRNNDIFQPITNRYNIVVPYVYKEFNTISNNIIVMEFIEGGSLLESKNDMRFFQTNSRNIQRFIQDSYLIYKIIHADLHTGNIICRDDKIGLIDFGLVIKLSDKQGEYIADLLLSIRNKNFNRLVSSIGKLVCNGDKLLYKQFIDVCNTSDKMEPLRNNFKSFSCKLILDVIQIFNSITIDPNNDSIKILLSLVSSFSVIDLCRINPNEPIEESLFKFDNN